MVSLAQVLFDNTRFWGFFLSANYPCALQEETGCTMEDFVGESLPVDMEWIDSFTQYDKNGNVFDESDGYLDNPTTLTASLGNLGNLKIEFHPGDTIFFLNDTEIGCTGPHWKLWNLPYSRIKEVLGQENGGVLFELLLPMAVVEPEEAGEVRKIVEKHFLELGFGQRDLPQAVDCLISGILRQEEVCNEILSQ